MHSRFVFFTGKEKRGFDCYVGRILQRHIVRFCGKWFLEQKTESY